MPSAKGTKNYPKQRRSERNNLKTKQSWTLDELEANIENKM